MRIVRTVKAMQRLAREYRQSGLQIGLVPMMGSLHEGHLSLVRRARRSVSSRGRVVVSIYVNPTQFGPSEDFENYPRDFRRDVQLCRAAGVDLIFAPSNSEMYPAAAGRTFSTFVTEEDLACPMEGASRPTHFRGVATVVAKLFNIVAPDWAVFGQKDYQQAAVIQRMVRDLNFPVKVLVAPTLRELDGLAMSSRNQYLSAAERLQATALCQSIALARRMVRSTVRGYPVSRLQKALSAFISQHPAARVDYICVFDPITLQPLRRAERGSHLALAVFMGRTRLIDNGEL